MPWDGCVTLLTWSRENVDGPHSSNALMSATDDLPVGAIRSLIRLRAAVLRELNAKTATTPASTNTPSMRSAFLCIVIPLSSEGYLAACLALACSTVPGYRSRGRSSEADRGRAPSARALGKADRQAVRVNIP